ncbi:MAG TPA: UDP-2,3-diacylglucosamine diphosphatase, partial [Thiotrichales bacterium]|nr:UDP-2,3-diacylglucosamine diphosphatase [Thiotrichales bacterium]
MTPPTLFISDLHLDAARPEIVGLFRRFLAGLSPDNCAALYVLGDLFEAWIGDDEDDPAALQVLADLGGLVQRGVPLYLMRGNRDFLMGSG